MKNLFFSLFFVFINTFISAQTKDWKQIDVPFITSINLLYQSEQGFLFGVMTVTNELVYSVDSGKNWNKILISDPLESYYFGFKENSKGEIFYYSNENIFKFDTLNLKLNRIITFGQYNYIKDVAFLKTGELVVATSDSLSIYSDDGTYKKSQQWYYDIVRILPDKINQKNYVVVSDIGYDYLIEFNDDFSNFSERKKIPEFYYPVSRIDDRLFADEYYSDNGGTSWKKFNFLKDANVYMTNIGHDGANYWCDYDKLFISYDKGNTFVERTYPENTTPNSYINYISSADNGDIAISYFDCFVSSIYISNNSGETWNEKNTKIGVPHTSGFSLLPLQDENIILDGGCIKLIKKSNSSNWEKLNPSFYGADNDYLRMSFVSNNYLLMFNLVDELHNSKDLGNTWQKINYSFDLFGYRNLFEKSGKIFVPGYEKLYYSNDFGQKWNEYNILDDDISYNFSNADASSFNFDFDFFYRDIFFKYFVHYNFRTKEKNILSLPFDSDIFTTTFDNYDLYFLNYKSESGKDNLYLNRSTDNGNSFSEKLIKNDVSNSDKFAIKIDNNNYIYLYNKKEILVSTDTGLTWQNLSPDFSDLISINDLQVSYDDYIYISTVGKGILKYNHNVTKTKEWNDLEFKIYPNPNSGKFTIKLLQKDNKDNFLQITDIQGNIIRKQKLVDNEVQIDISDARPGIYFVNVMSGKRIFNYKLNKY